MRYNGCGYAENAPDSSLLRPDPHTLDIVARLTHSLKLGMNLVRSVNSGLGMEFSGVRDFEKDVLHNVGAEGHLELELFALNSVDLRSNADKAEGEFIP